MGKETGKGIKGDLKKLEAIISDYSDDELTKIGYEGRNININDINEIIKFIQNQ